MGDTFMYLPGVLGVGFIAYGVFSILDGKYRAGTKQVEGNLARLLGALVAIVGVLNLGYLIASNVVGILPQRTNFPLLIGSVVLFAVVNLVAHFFGE